MPRRRKPENNGPSPRNLEIYALVCEGKQTGEAIGEQFGICKQRVNQIRNQVENWARPQWLGKIDVIKEKQTQLLMHLFQQAMEEWEQSKRSAVKRTKKTGGMYGGEDSESEEGQCGDPRYLDQARQCLADIRKIWGANVQGDAPSLNLQFNIAELRQQMVADPDYIEVQRRKALELVSIPANSNGNGNGHHGSNGNGHHA